jgi:hypothetical protein
MSKLNGKVVVVTGAAKGIGATIARAPGSGMGGGRRKSFEQSICSRGRRNAHRGERRKAIAVKWMCRNRMTSPSVWRDK